MKIKILIKMINIIFFLYYNNANVQILVKVKQTTNTQQQCILVMSYFSLIVFQIRFSLNVYAFSD